MWVCVITGLYLLEHLCFVVTAALIVLLTPNCVSQKAEVSSIWQTLVMPPAEQVTWCRDSINDFALIFSD